MDVYLKTWKVNLVPPFLEPILYLLAMGFGLGIFVQQIEGLPYVVFISPALVAIAVLNSSFFECTYGSFVRMTYQKTFDAIVATPLSLEEVVIGEMIWGATKGMLYGGIVLGVVAALGLASFPLLLIVIPFSFLFGLLASALAMCCTALAPTIDSFNYATFLLITPMFLFSGTFFPLSILPESVQTIVLIVLPLPHAVIISRQLMVNSINLGQMLLSFSWIGIATTVLFVLAVVAMNRKIIK